MLTVLADDLILDVGIPVVVEARRTAHHVTIVEVIIGTVAHILPSRVGLATAGRVLFEGCHGLIAWMTIWSSIFLMALLMPQDLP